MLKVVSKQAKEVIEYLTKNGFTREKPFLPKEKTIIQEVCEIPGKYEYFYDILLVSLWPEDENLFVVVDQIIDGNAEGMPMEQIILDSNPEEEDWENGLGTLMGPELWRWNLDAVTALFQET